MKKENILILHNIRSVQNVGAIFRTADACGISKIIISGYTASPIDRFGRKRTDVSKAALGAEDTVSWEEVTDIFSEIKHFKENGFYVISIEQTENSIDYKDVTPKEKNVFIIGNEVDGIQKELIELSDVVAEIPMLGEKESLNVSVATGVSLFRILNI